MTIDPADRFLTAAQRELLVDLRGYGEAAQGLGSGDTALPSRDLPHSPEVARDLAERGWWGLTVDPRYGGSGGGFTEVALFAEEAFRAQLPISGYLPTFIVVTALNAFGTEAQRSELLGRAAAGGVLAIAITEPLVGSDAACVDTRATRGLAERLGLADQRAQALVHHGSPGEPHPGVLPHE